MGTGTNVQRRLVALHHVDAPWKPSSIEQRDGRILRQGNTNPEVSIYRYVTEQSFDAFMWQALETKAKFINQVMAGKTGLRRADDIGGQELSYAEVKAIASGNAAVLTLAESDAELQRLAILKKNHADEQFIARRKIKELPDSIARLEGKLDNLIADSRLAVSHASDSFRSTALSDPEESNETLEQQLTALPETGNRQRFKLGTYKGFECGMIVNGSAKYTYLHGAAEYTEHLMGQAPGPRAILNSFSRLLNTIDNDIKMTQRELGVQRQQLVDYQGRFGKPFVEGQCLDDLQSLRDQLRLALSGETTELSCEQLKQDIETLRATQMHKSGTSARAEQETIATVEEPIAVTIRRKLLEREAIQSETNGPPMPKQWRLDCFRSAKLTPLVCE